MIRLISALLLLASPLAAERILTPEEFDAISRGQTQYFYQDGEFYGAEQFNENQESIWMFSNGDCTKGYWYPEEDFICFQYETPDFPQCWLMIEKDNGDIVARLLQSEPEYDIVLEFRNRDPLPCGGPEVGV
ncbi:MAG: hypothetical protein AAF826_07640 [Pseudomonadota bacterium]